ncbi:hypothetical protein [Massilia sp. CCM 8734]|uniref:hypothetical protein n=1 Tax=Massilia sp. CCM 8734 TaxID=2609283 RepID=UPI0014220E6A|nr:hypothetical protein [Massilia sp. CCM 8734]NHZ99368.1 hypothetical protein [Massilia sp. CCM 8734]
MKKSVLNRRARQALSSVARSNRTGEIPPADLETEVARARAYLEENRADFLIRSAKARLMLPDCEVTAMIGPIPQQD